MKLLKLVACYFSSLSILLTPMAEAKSKENQRRESIEQYLKNTGLSTKKQTAGEFWFSVRHVFPQNMRYSLDRWVSLNREQMMPSVQVTNFKDASGVEQVRLLFTHEGQSVTVTYTGSEEFPLKINGVTFSKKEVNSHDLNKIAARLIKEDTSVAKAYKKGNLPSLRKTNLVLKYSEFKRLTARQKAEYLIRLRQTMEAAVKVFEKTRGKTALQELNQKYEWAHSFFFGENAYAESLMGKSCVIAGFISKYGENGSCAGVQSGSADLSAQARNLGASCGGDATPCNPLVYGFDEAGKSYCVARSEIKYATAKCNTMSPLRAGPDGDQDKKRIIESYLKVKEKKTGVNLSIQNGEVSEEQLKEVSGYLANLNNLIGEARSHCDSRAEAREDQSSACTELLTRSMDLQAFSGGAVTPPATGELPGGDCNSQKPGSLASGDGQSCLCPDGTTDGQMNGRPACVALETGSGKPMPPKSACGFWCRNSGWIIGAAVGIAVFAGIWWLIDQDSNSKPKPQVYTPPAGPAQDICVSPATLVDGVCQTPVVENPPAVAPPPPVVVSEAGTGSNSGDSSGGTR